MDKPQNGRGRAVAHWSRGWLGRAGEQCGTGPVLPTGRFGERVSAKVFGNTCSCVMPTQGEHGSTRRMTVRLVRGDANDVGPALHFLIEPLSGSLDEIRRQCSDGSDR